MLELWELTMGCRIQKIVRVPEKFENRILYLDAVMKPSCTTRKLTFFKF